MNSPGPPPMRPMRSRARPDSSYNHYILNNPRPLSSATAPTLSMNFFRPKERDADSPITRKPSTVLRPKQSIASLASDNTVTPPDNTQVLSNNTPFITKSRMRVQAYSVPYMQAYEVNQLSNDRSTELLLRRLTPTGGPSFYDYAKRHPQSVLDLGAGAGHWVKHAAACWKNSRIVAFDLVKLDDFEDTNIEFVQGDFLAPKLPFDDCSFDLVRMANLTLAIPTSQWKFVVSEAHRVLTYGGRLEIIDDQLIFPYGKKPLPKFPSPSSADSLTRLWADSSPSDFDLDDSEEEDDLSDDDTLDTETDCFSAAPTLVDSDTASSSSHEKVADLVKEIPTPPLPPEDAEKPYPSALLPPMPSWTERVTDSSDLEKLFRDMLLRRYGIDSKPSDFLPQVLDLIFGVKHTAKLPSMHLCLPQIETPPPSPKLDSVQARPRIRKLMSIDWDLRNFSGKVPVSAVPEGISAKAACRLGIDYSTLANISASTSPTKRPSSSSSSLSSSSSHPVGLVLLSPSLFVQLTPSELEALSTAHMQTLLGCKPSLQEYFSGFIDEKGTSIFDSTVFEDTISDYEAFLRERFGWSPEMPGNFEDDEPEQPPPPRSKPSSQETTDFINSLKDHDLLHVRTFRVFEGVKALI